MYPLYICCVPRCGGSEPTKDIEHIKYLYVKVTDSLESAQIQIQSEITSCQLKIVNVLLYENA